jgi:hypothetical protein
MKDKDKIKPEDKAGICFCSCCNVMGFAYYDDDGTLQNNMICQNTAHSPYWFVIPFNSMESWEVTKQIDNHVVALINTEEDLL